MMQRFLFVFLLCALLAFEAEALFPRRSDKIKCPPRGFDSVKDFDPESFISKSWFVQEQAVVAYLGRDTFYCVAATYELKNPKNLFDGLTVYNYANQDKVNGEVFGTSGSGDSSSYIGGLEAVFPNPDDPSKLLVGPSFIVDVTPKSLRSTVLGDYWVVWVHEDEKGEYDLAIIGGGAPDFSTEKGCQTGNPALSRFLVNGVGTWLFSRKPYDPEGTAIMRQAAIDLGYDLSDLYPVEQKGCLYDEAVLK